MKREHDKILGCDKALYRIDAILDNVVVGSIEVIAHSKFDAYYTVNKLLPEHNNFNYEHIRWATEDEPYGVFGNTPHC